MPFEVISDGQAFIILQMDFIHLIATAKINRKGYWVQQLTHDEIWCMAVFFVFASARTIALVSWLQRMHHLLLIWCASGQSVCLWNNIPFFVQRLNMDVGSLMEKSIDRSASVPSHQLHSIAIKYKRLDIWSVWRKRKKNTIDPLYKWLPLDFTSWSRCHSTWVTFYSILPFLYVSHHFRIEITWNFYEKVYSWLFFFSTCKMGHV